MRKSWVGLLTFIALLIVWECAVRLFALPLYILPAPSAIARAFVSMRGVIWPHLWATLLETLLGVVLAAALGAAVALIMDAFPKVKAALYPLLALSQAIPVLVIAPLLIIYLGFGMAPKVFTVVLMCFFPIAVNMTASMARADADTVNMLRSLGAGRLAVYKNLLLPMALPGFFSGLRISATYSVTGAVVGEWLSSEKGLGFFMLRAKNAYMLDRVFAVVALIVLLSLLLLGAVVLLERAAMPYLKKKQV